MTIRKLTLIILTLVSTFITGADIATAHSGRTDSNGGHNCYVGACAGTYHYHNGGGTPAPAPTPAPAYTPPPAPTPAPQPVYTPPPETIKVVPKPKTIERLRTLRSAAATSNVLWVDLLMTEIGMAKTASEYATINPAEAASRRITQVTEQNRVVDNQTLYYVKSIVDGDTIKVVKDGKLETVRLLGIDTPETKDPRKPVQCFGKEASAYITQLALDKYVQLEPDRSQGDRDKYQRLLRYVYLQDGTNVNAEMVRSGYAVAYVRYPVQQLEEFKRLQRIAMDSESGLWSACR